MGNKLFGVNISKLIKDNVGPGVLPATLVKITPGTRTPGQLTGGTNPTETSYPCRGFLDTQAVEFQDGTLIKSGTKVAVLIGDTIDNGNIAPANGDHVVLEGTTYLISKINRDPAAATYTCEIRSL